MQRRDIAAANLSAENTEDEADEQTPRQNYVVYRPPIAA